MTTLQTETLSFRRKGKDVVQNLRASEGPGEMAGWLGMLTALSEYLSLVPNTISGGSQLLVTPAPPTQIKGQTSLVPR